jgi:hypothetical protein
MSGDHNQYQKDKSYLDFECPRCGHSCYVDDDNTSQERVDETTKQEQEPWAWANSLDFDDDDIEIIPARAKGKLGTSNCDIPLYTAPQKKEWVGLTDEEIDVIYEQHHNQYGECESPNFGYERAIEQALKEKNT